MKLFLIFLIGFNPLMAQDYLRVGVNYFSAGDPVKAIESFKMAIGDSNYPQARLHLFIGIAYLFPSDTVRAADAIPAAMGEFDKAMEIDSGFADAHYWRGKTNEMAGDTAWALEEYETATKLNRKYAEAYNQWGIILYSKGDYYGAELKFRKAILCEIDNQAYNATFHFNLSFALLARNYFAESAEEMERARRINNNINPEERAIMCRPMRLENE